MSRTSVSVARAIQFSIFWDVFEESDLVGAVYNQGPHPFWEGGPDPLLGRDTGS